MSFSGTGRGHIARSAMESIAYAIRANLEQIEDVSRLKAGQVSVGGGMTRSPIWTQILVNVLGRSLKVSSTPSVSTMGAYLCASTAIGNSSSLDEAAQTAEKYMVTMESDASKSLEYKA